MSIRSAAPFIRAGTSLTKLLDVDAAADEPTGARTTGRLAARDARTGMMKRIGIIVVALGLMACAAVQAQSERRQDPAQGQTWSVGTRPAMTLTEGEVERVDKEHSEVIIHHGDLPNLGMEAMTMGFAVAEKRMLDNLRPGDKVRFNAEIKNGEATVTYIESAR
ncbi:copper-binding protein [Variovorax ureilyticus]|uniref:Copper-binding protein n=1 Tax=Variovorax ureilyticus TaxID=1836198 RepID=A0ABU8VJE2_9BURK